MSAPGSNKGGAPPEGSPRQCKANSQVTRVRCRRWALISSNYCQFHGGRQAAKFYRPYNRKTKLPDYYSKYLGPKLSQVVNELLDAPHDDQVSLYNELAIARASAMQALALAQPLFEESSDVKLNPELKALIIATLGESMKNVKELVLAASKLEKESSDKVSIKVINLVVHQIITAINDVCGTENMVIAEAIAKAIDERVRLPLNDKLNPTIKVNVLPTVDALLTG